MSEIPRRFFHSGHTSEEPYCPCSASVGYQMEPGLFELPHFNSQTDQTVPKPVSAPGPAQVSVPVYTVFQSSPVVLLLNCSPGTGTGARTSSSSGQEALAVTVTSSSIPRGPGYYHYQPQPPSQPQVYSSFWRVEPEFGLEPTSAYTSTMGVTTVSYQQQRHPHMVVTHPDPPQTLTFANRTFGHRNDELIPSRYEYLYHSYLRQPELEPELERQVPMISEQDQQYQHAGLASSTKRYENRSTQVNPRDFVRSEMIYRSNRRKRLFCTFCKNNGETASVYTGHTLHNNEDKTSCPVLMKYVCPLCAKTGEDAHTIKYCPKIPKELQITSVQLPVRKQGRNAAGGFCSLKY